MKLLIHLHMNTNTISKNYDKMHINQTSHIQIFENYNNIRLDDNTFFRKYFIDNH